MKRGPSESPNDYLSNVCWGYRDEFRRIVENLAAKGLIGSGNPVVSALMNEHLNRPGGRLHDHVVKEFLSSLNEDNEWLLTIPSIFEGLTKLGFDLASVNIYFAVRFFRIFGEGGLGATPEEVDFTVRIIRELCRTDPELAYVFFSAYKRLAGRMNTLQIRRYAHSAVDMFARSRDTAFAFLKGELNVSETAIREITREVHLHDLAPALGRLFKALTGDARTPEPSGRIRFDSPDKRAPNVVCHGASIYLPEKISSFPETRDNRQLYYLCVEAAAASVCCGSFSRVHGLPEYPDCTVLFGPSRFKANLFVLLEYLRILVYMRKNWPGVRRPLQRLLDYGPGTEDDIGPAIMDLFRDIHGKERLNRIAAELGTFHDTYHLIQNGEELEAIGKSLQIPCDRYLTPFLFFPDYLVRYAGPSVDGQALIPAAGLNGRTLDPADAAGPEEGGGPPADLSWTYDEWSRDENDYLRNYCTLREKRVSRESGPAERLVPEDEVGKVRRIFERIRPVLLRKRKYLTDGDCINQEVLTDFIVRERVEPSPRINFFEKPFILHRDPAVLLLLDLSGSTSQKSGDEQVLRLEQKAAVLLGEGMSCLGDAFAVAGFSGNGRDDSQFYIFKDFYESWDVDVIRRISAAVPLNSTRMGVAIRHGGYRLGSLKKKQKMIILISDGRPNDIRYDPETGYAQADVRMACEENRRRGIHTFCISSIANTKCDMEMMFPGNSFCVLSDLRLLPKLLPRIYLHLTV